MCVLCEKRRSHFTQKLPCQAELSLFFVMPFLCFPIISVSDARAKYNKFSPSGAIKFYGLEIFRHTLFAVDKLMHAPRQKRVESLILYIARGLSLTLLTFPHAGGGKVLSCWYGSENCVLFIAAKGWCTLDQNIAICCICWGENGSRVFSTSSARAQLDRLVLSLCASFLYCRRRQPTSNAAALACSQGKYFHSIFLWHGQISESCLSFLNFMTKYVTFDVILLIQKFENNQKKRANPRNKHSRRYNKRNKLYFKIILSTFHLHSNL